MVETASSASRSISRASTRLRARGFLASNTQERDSILHGPTDGAHVVEAGVVWAQDPDGVHRGEELICRAVSPARPETHLVCPHRQRLAVGEGRAEDPSHLGIAYAEERLEVEARDKAAAEETYA